VNILKFADEVKREVKKVTWPTLSETRASTIMVFIMVAFASLFLFAADQVINSVIKLILGLKGQ